MNMWDLAMNLKNVPPVFVPSAYIDEMEKLSKAALMDLVWDFAILSGGAESDPERTMAIFRARAAVVLLHRANPARRSRAG